MGPLILGTAVLQVHNKGHGLLTTAKTVNLFWLLYWLNVRVVRLDMNRMDT